MTAIEIATIITVAIAARPQDVIDVILPEKKKKKKMLVEELNWIKKERAIRDNDRRQQLRIRGQGQVEK